ncbi:hypothetical protein [Azospirillum doebereinerae]
MSRAWEAKPEKRALFMDWHRHRPLMPHAQVIAGQDEFLYIKSFPK